MRTTGGYDLARPDAKFTDPLEPHRVVGNLYAVGTRDLGVFFLPTEEGHILINTGVRGSLGSIAESIARLGHDIYDTRILLSMQSHWDHTADLAEVKRLTGAKLLATGRDRRILEDGGYSDPHFGGAETFEPVSVDDTLDHGSVVQLGSTRLITHLHPGHTEGSSSYEMEVTEGRETLRVLIVNMPTINKGKRLVRDPTYPGVLDDFESTLEHQASLSPDIWVAAHGSHYRLHDKLEPGAPHDPNRFRDPEGYRAAIAEMRRRLTSYLEAETASA